MIMCRGHVTTLSRCSRSGWGVFHEGARAIAEEEDQGRGDFQMGRARLNRVDRSKWADRSGPIEVGRAKWAEPSEPSQVGRAKWAKPSGPTKAGRISFAK